MKLFKRILFYLSVIIVLLTVAAYIYLNNIKTAAIPDYNKSLAINGLEDEVTVLRDSFGIPHIYAKTEEDLCRATGFVMAQDRLWQMDLLRRVTQGRLSEILGKDQKNTDLLMRALRIEEKSERILKKLNPEVVAQLNAFAEGMNYYIENYPLPPEFKILRYKPEPWKPVHSINLIGYMSWDLTSGWGIESLLYQLKNVISAEKLNDLIPDMGNHKTAVFPGFKYSGIDIDNTLLSASDNLKELGIEVFEGSNNWAVSGKKSKTGKPLLANDMHLGLFAPGIWYQLHLNVAGKLNVTGLAIPGQPYIIAGHNDSIAWGMTNVMVDDLDFYAETLNKDSTKYLLNGEWKDLIIRKEIIKTKEGNDIEKTLRFTHRGPIVNDLKPGETPLSIHWIGNEMSNEIRSIYLLNRAKNWSDFRSAVSTFKSVSQNIVYADVKGNIGLQTSAGIPIRKGNAIDIFPGDTTEYDWTGLVPFEELPFEFNPERGYVSSANNKTVPDDYPYYISRWFVVPNRIDRIREMLEDKEKLGIADFQQMHSDVKSKKAERMVPVFLVALNSGHEWDNDEQAVVKLLEEWDFVMSRKSSAASVFEIMYRKVLENLIKDDVNEKYFKALMGQKMLLENLMLNILSRKTSEWTDDKNTPQTETFNDIVIRSFKETVSDLTAQFGKNISSWQWGTLHTFTIKHPLGAVPVLDKLFHLNRGPFAVPGSFHTVCPYSYSYNNLYKATHGASHRHIFDVSNWDNSKTVIPTGTSGISASKFYLDQTEMYINNRYHNDPFSKNSVEKEAQFKMKLIPRK